MKGKLATGEFGGILYEAGKPFTGEKDGIFYKDGKKDEDQTNVANFKKAEAEVQKANDAFKKAKEQKDALDALAKKAGVSTQANLQTKNAADIDAFLAKYKDVDVSKLEGAELTEFKSALATNLTLATENLKTASTNVTNAVNTFVAAASVIASTADDALLAHIKTAVATATTVVASLKAAGYDTVQLENALSKLPGGTTGGGNNNSGGGSTGGSGSTGGGGNNNGGSTETVEQKFEKLATAQAKVTATQAELDDLLAKQEAINSMEEGIEEVTQNKNLSVSSKYEVVPTVEEFFKRYPEGYSSGTNINNFREDLNAVKLLLNKEIATTTTTLIKETDTLFWAIKEAVAVALDSNKLQFIQIATLQAILSIKDIQAAGGSVTELEKALNKLPASAKPSDDTKLKLVTAKVDALLSADGKALAEGVTQAQISEAKKLVGTLPEDTEQSTTKKAELLAKVENAQKLFTEQEANKTEAEKVKAVTALVDALFAKDSEGKVDYNKLANGVTQAQITAATTAVNDLKDGSALSDNVEKAQDLLDTAIIEATIAVDDLFAEKEITPSTGGNTEDGNTEDGTSGGTTPATSTTEGNGNTDDNTTSPAEEPTKVERDYTKLADGVTQDQITHAKDLVDALPKDAEGKETLTKHVKEAQGLLNKQIAADAEAKLQAATTAVDALFGTKQDGDKTVPDYGTLAEGVTQDQITKAQDLVDALPEDAKGKDTLTKHVKEAQGLLDAAITTATKAVDELFAIKETTPPTEGTDGDDNGSEEGGNTDGGNGTSEPNTLTTEGNDPTGETPPTVEEPTKVERDYEKLADGVTQDQITKAKALVNALPKDAKGKDTLTTHVEKAQGLLDAAITTATTAVNALFTDSSPEKEIATSTTQETIQAAEALVNALPTDAKGLQALKAAITSAKDKLKAITDKYDANKGLQTDGTLAVKGDFDTIDDAGFTFQMAGIELDNTGVKYVSGTKNQAQSLTATQVTQGLQATITGKQQATSADNASITFKVEKKYGYTIFTVENTLSVDQFNVLDGNLNGVYFVTVNTKGADNKYTRVHKVLVELKDDKITTSFVADTVTDDQYSITAAEKTVAGLFNGTALKDSTTQADITKADELVEKITNKTKKDELKGKVTNAQKLFDTAVKLKEATEAVKALFTDETKTVIKESTDEKAIADALAKINELSNNEQEYTDLRGAITLATELLKLATPLQENGTLAIKGTFDSFDETKLTFQMTSIYLNGEEPTYYTTGHAQSKVLTTEQASEGLQAIINGKQAAVTENKVSADNASISFTQETKHGYTIFEANATLTKDQFNILDDNKNGAFLVSVNENSVRKYKILFQLNGEKVTAKFVSGSVLDKDFTIPTPQP